MKYSVKFIPAQGIPQFFISNNKKETCDNAIKFLNYNNLGKLKLIKYSRVTGYKTLQITENTGFKKQQTLNFYK